MARFYSLERYRCPWQQISHDFFEGAGFRKVISRQRSPRLRHFKQLDCSGVGSSPTIISGDWQEPWFNLGIEAKRCGRLKITMVGGEMAESAMCFYRSYRVTDQLVHPAKRVQCSRSSYSFKKNFTLLI